MTSSVDFENIESINFKVEFKNGKTKEFDTFSYDKDDLFDLYHKFFFGKGSRYNLVADTKTHVTVIDMNEIQTIEIREYGHES